MPRNPEPTLEEVAARRRAEKACQCWVHTTLKPEHIAKIDEKLVPDYGKHWRHKDVGIVDVVVWLRELHYDEATQAKIDFYLRKHFAEAPGR